MNTLKSNETRIFASLLQLLGKDRIIHLYAPNRPYVRFAKSRDITTPYGKGYIYSLKSERHTYQIEKGIKGELLFVVIDERQQPDDLSGLKVFVTYYKNGEEKYCIQKIKNEKKSNTDIALELRLLYIASLTLVKLEVSGYTE